MTNKPREAIKVRIELAITLDPQLWGEPSAWIPAPDLALASARREYVRDWFRDSGDLIDEVTPQMLLDGIVGVDLVPLEVDRVPE